MVSWFELKRIMSLFLRTVFLYICAVVAVHGNDCTWKGQLCSNVLENGWGEMTKHHWCKRSSIGSAHSLPQGGNMTMHHAMHVRGTRM